MNGTWLKNSKCFCILGMLCILSITRCKKLVHVDDPDDSLTTTAVFSNDSLAQAAVTGLYINIMKSPKLLLNGGMSLFPGLSSDELQRNSTVTTELEFYNNSISPSNSLASAFLWKAAYAYIYQCNVCIEGLKRSTGVSDEQRKQLLGEVQFVRALCYHYLVNLYGDVPLAIGTNADVNAMLSRSSVNEVYQQIEADLTDASEELTDDNANTRPTKYAALALLARVYLYTKQWSKAAGMASAVINSGRFVMVGDLNKVFTHESKEIIFQWAPVGDRMNSSEGFIFVPAAQKQPTYWLKKDLLSAFEHGDLRKSKWLDSVTIGTVTYYYPYKFKLITSSAPAQEYNVVLRLAEQYLIGAEAYAQLNKIDSAVIDLNAIRSRAELPVFSATISADTCLQKIEQERRIELFAEWGHRWFDLKRTNRANDVLSAKGSSWSTNDQLYPIPTTELEFAPNLKQNPGYE